MPRNYRRELYTRLLDCSNGLKGHGTTVRLCLDVSQRVLLVGSAGDWRTRVLRVVAQKG